MWECFLKQRLLWVDAVRGFAIVLMVIFHFCYDLRYFGYVDWHIPNGPHWWPFRYLIITLFIFTVGVSLSLAHKNHFNQSTFIKRIAQLIVSAAAITIMSLFLFPKAWIYFGILHFIAAASLLGILLVRAPYISLVIGGVILVGYWLGLLSNTWPFEWFSQWLPDDTEDFVPLFPWLGVMYIGVGFAGVFPIKKFDISRNKLTNNLGFIGKHGLIIYLVHQPLLFAGFILINAIK